MHFSVVIPTYNRWDTLRQTLAAVCAQTHPAHEIIVVDDGSTDDTPTALPRDFPQVLYVRQANAGPATARNTGLARASGEAIAFTDDDCVPPPDWLEKLALGLAHHPDVVGVGGALLAAPAVRQTNVLARYEEYGVRVLAGAGDQPVHGGFECPAGGTNNMAYRREALTAIGGFDVSFPYAAGEDADLKWRLAQTGARFFYLPVVVTHLQPYTWAAFCKQQFTRGKGQVYFERKWARPPSRLKIIGRLVLNSLRWLSRWPTLPEAAFIRPALAEVWHHARGQWQALTEITS